MILVTGFEPFGGLTRNPSGDAALAVVDVAAGIRGAVLPVDYARIGRALEDLLSEPWDAVVLTGVAVGRGKISLERIAINYRDSLRPDNAGVIPELREVVSGGPAAFFSTLPVDELRDGLTAAGLPAEVSLTAGAYLCNAAFYTARYRLEASGTPCGFIHVPPTPDLACGAEPLPLEETIRALRLVVAVLRGEG